MSCRLRPSHKLPVRFSGAYDSSRLQNLTQFQQHTHTVRGLRPSAVHLATVTVLDLPWGAMRGPSNFLRRQCKRYIHNASYSPRGYNPSVVRAPDGLCSRCYYLAAVRVDAQHGCNARGAIQRGYTGTAMVVLDANLRTLAWCWWYNNPAIQLTGARTWGLEWDLPHQASATQSIGEPRDGLPLPWPNTKYDVRLVNVRRGTILATHQCRQCKAFSVQLVQIRGDRSLVGGGLRSLHAWSNGGNDSIVWHPSQHKGWGALAGCNQALFVEEITTATMPPQQRQQRQKVEEASPPPTTPFSVRLLLQTWLDAVVGLGDVRFAPSSPQSSPLDDSSTSPLDRLASITRRPNRYRGPPINTRPEMGTAGGDDSLGALLGLKAIGSEAVAPSASVDDRQAGLAERQRRRHRGQRATPPVGGRASKLASGAARLLANNVASPARASPLLSLTSNLVRLELPHGILQSALGKQSEHGRRAGSNAHGAAAAGSSPRQILLGIAHLHRGQSTDGKVWRLASMGKRDRPRQPFRWGYEYSHVLYAISNEPPYHLLATSAELCFASPQRRSENGTAVSTHGCESVQMATGLAEGPRLRTTEQSSQLLLAYGANDCEAKLALVPLSWVWSALIPL